MPLGSGETGGWAWARGGGGRGPAIWLTLTHRRLPRLWAVAEAHCPLADGPAGTRGAQHPPPATPATPRLSPPEATLPGPHR